MLLPLFNHQMVHTYEGELHAWVCEFQCELIELETGGYSW